MKYSPVLRPFRRNKNSSKTASCLRGDRYAAEEECHIGEIARVVGCVGAMSTMLCRSIKPRVELYSDEKEVVAPSYMVLGTL